MLESLWIVALDSALVVVGVDRLSPGATITVAAADLVLELPGGLCPPRLGETLAVRPMLAPWPAT